MKLFSQSSEKRKKRKLKIEEKLKDPKKVYSKQNNAAKYENHKKSEVETVKLCDEMDDVDGNVKSCNTYLSSFEGLGLCDWVCRACLNMGFREPTPIQKHCIPAILQGQDVLGCAETGSGKTAAFALPILHHLSQDPYGIFAIVLTPTRELAIQIHEQFLAFGTPMGLKTALVIGGLNMLEQSLALKQRPHVVVGTPGRIRAHLQGPDPPAVTHLKYIVLDEADRLLSEGFEKDLSKILSYCPPSPKRQTLLLSATLTDALNQLKSLAMTEPKLYNLTHTIQIPENLEQQYLFMPQQIKVPYLFEALRQLTQTDVWGGESGEEDDQDLESKLARSAMIFTGTCKKCQEICEILCELGVECVSLHSIMTQNRRLAALGKFKSQQVKILVSTDVGSRGLDIPEVDLVINFDMPRAAVDYIHRVGRTARAGRAGRAVSLVSQYEVGLVHTVEEYTGSKLQLCEEVAEEEVLKLLNPVSKATRVARMKLLQQGFDDKVEEIQQRKKKRKKKRSDV